MSFSGVCIYCVETESVAVVWWRCISQGAVTLKPPMRKPMSAVHERLVIVCRGRTVVGTSGCSKCAFRMLQFLASF